MNLKRIDQMSLRGRFFAYFCIFFAVCGIFYYFFMHPFITSIMKLRSEILGLKIDIEKRLVKDSSINKINENLEKIEPQIEKLDQIFINKNREIEFITTFEEIAVRNNIAQKLNLGPVATNESGYSKNNIEIVAQGSLNNVIKYLQDIERMNYYINIYTLDMSRVSIVAQDRSSANTSSFSEEVSIKLSANTYWK